MLSHLMPRCRKIFYCAMLSWLARPASRKTAAYIFLLRLPEAGFARLQRLSLSIVILTLGAQKLVYIVNNNKKML